MSSRQSLQCFTSTTQPPATQVGDEWFNPTTNKLYKYVTISGQAPTWAEMPTASSGTVPITSLSVSGGTGSFSGSTTNLAVSLNNVGEQVSIITTALTGVVNYDATTQSIVYFTNVTGNWTINFRGSATTALNSVLSAGQSLTLVVMASNGGTAYLPSAIQIDGTAITPKWQGGTAPTAGNASSIDAYSYTIIKTTNATYTVLCSQTKFA